MTQTPTSPPTEHPRVEVLVLDKSSALGAQEQGSTSSPPAPALVPDCLQEQGTQFQVFVDEGSSAPHQEPGRLQAQEAAKERSHGASQGSAPCLSCEPLQLPLPTAAAGWRGSVLHQAVDLCEQHVRLRLWGERRESKQSLTAANHPAAAGRPAQKAGWRRAWASPAPSHRAVC